jgi:hypothetical protein
MLPVVRDDARRAVAALLVAIAGVAAAFAGVAAASHPAWLVACIVIAVVAAGLAVAVELPDVKMLLDGRLRIPRSRRSRVLPPPAPALPAPSPVMTDRWLYTSDGDRARAAMRAGELVMPGTGYRLQPGDRPPWVRFLVLIACSQIAPDTEPAQLWPDFVGFLKDQPVISLVNGLTCSRPGVRWTRWATRSAGTIDAVFTTGEEKDALASARLELPDGTRRSFRDERCALLILHFEPPAESGNGMSPMGPIAWTDHMKRALELPRALNRLLTEQLGLSTSADPPVVLGFRLDAPHDLAELIDVAGLNTLPGGHHGREAIGYFIDDPAGSLAPEVISRMISDVLLYALQAER